MGDTAGAGAAMGGAGGGKSGGGGSLSSLTGGGDTSGLGMGDMSGLDASGMGGMDPSMGGMAPDMGTMGDFGGGGAPTSSSGVQQMAGRMSSGLDQSQPTDQPKQAPPPQQPPPQQQPQLSHGQQIFGGHMPGEPIGPTSTPGVQVASNDPQQAFQQLARVEMLDTAPPSATTSSPSIEIPQQGSPESQLGLPEKPDPNIMTGSQHDAGPYTGYDPTATGTTPPTSTASAGPMMAPGATPDTTDAGTSVTTGYHQPVTTPPGTPAAGAAQQSPLEQLISGFLHMILGGGQGGMGPLEQLIGRMFGINPRQMWHPYYGNPFQQRPPGPGYFPGGTQGGRQIGAGPPGPQSPQVPTRPAPAPGAPGTLKAPQPQPPSFNPRRQESGLPGDIYTADRLDQPPPWYHPQGAATQGAAAGDNDYISRFGGHSTLNSVNQKGVQGLNPEFGSRLAAAGRAYQQETGQPPAYGEGYRDDRTQQQYWHQRGDRYDPRNPAARPIAYGGKGSLHESGAAMDLPNGGFQNWLARGNAARFGLGYPVPNDSNHIQMVDLKGNQYPYSGARLTASATPPTAPTAPNRRTITPQIAQTQKTVATTLQQAGASRNAISGIMANIADEPDKFWDPSDREYDRQGSGEAGYAHGLYQEGGDNWNRYQRWLQGRDWRDPQLQTQFLTQNLQQNYPRVWSRLNAATSPEQAAQIFLNEYLRPALKYRIARGQRYGRGVPAYEMND